MAILNFLKQRVAHLYKRAYNGKALGIQYEKSNNGLSMKAVLESSQSLVSLYAAYSEVSKRFLEVFFLVESYSLSAIGRAISSTLGIVVCSHIIFSTQSQGPSHIYTYDKIPRRVAGFIIWLVLLALAISIYDLLNLRKTYPEPPFATFQIGSELWKDVTVDPGNSDIRSYEAFLAVPEEIKKQTGNIMLSISPDQGYRLINVYPKEGTPVKTDQEVVKMSQSDRTPSRWLFPNFEAEKQWKVTVTVTKTDSRMAFPQHAPLVTTVYFIEK